MSGTPKLYKVLNILRRVRKDLGTFSQQGPPIDRAIQLIEDIDRIEKQKIKNKDLRDD